MDRGGCGLWQWCCGKRGEKGSKAKPGHKKKDSSQSLMDVHDAEEMQLLPSKWHARRFGVCHNFVMTTLELDGGCPVRAPSFESPSAQQAIDGVQAGISASRFNVRTV